MNDGELGFFDLANPLLEKIENVILVDMPPVVRLAIWAIIGAIISMGVYRLVSPQEKIKIAGSDTRDLIRKLAAYDGDFDGLTILIKSAFYASSRHFFIVLGPVVLASLPVLFLLSWLSYSYNVLVPAPGEQVTITVTPPTPGLTWSPTNSIESHSNSAWIIEWPAEPGELTLKNSKGITILSLPLPHAVDVLHKKSWWNVMFANPIGYLPESLELDLVLIQLPDQQILNFGPPWIRGWEATFFTVLILCSLLIKFIFRVR